MLGCRRFGSSANLWPDLRHSSNSQYPALNVRSFELCRRESGGQEFYVIPGSDAEEYVARRFPHKQLKRVSGGLRPSSIPGFLTGIRRTFQRGKAKGLNARYHFTFTGQEQHQATVVIADGTLQVEDGHTGQADMRVTADSNAWLGFLRKERSLVWAVLTRKLRFSGSPKLLLAFGRCFPS